ncbi:MAG: V-type ATP synthase subunit A [Gammaproteobacteria bacterium]
MVDLFSSELQSDQHRWQARVLAVQDGLITLETWADETGISPALTKNAVVHVLPSRRGPDERQERLKAEILRIRGNRADAQVFESTHGVGVGDWVELSDELLSVALGPGLLGSVYDGLQNPLNDLAVQYGTFLPRGVELPALDLQRLWLFKPVLKSGSRVKAGHVLGTVTEGRFEHRIMVPFDLSGDWEVDWIREGSYRVSEVVAQLQNQAGQQHAIHMQQQWPIRRSISHTLVAQSQAQRLYPQQPLVTTLRLIDTFFPIAKGGTGCIPGPFGAGKTVLQGLIARYSDVDIVIIVACGERAGEVVETIQEFPSMPDARTGGTLMDRTIIICNTSSMPVAAREASIYTGVTLAEYYQAMGFDVLLIADSTSRWAQAMRETSGRLEEIPGEEAFPAYLDSAIKAVYERAGVLQRQDQQETTGTFTMIGTVSPAGGNFEEPVTQSTLATVKTFLGLSTERAYRRFYPAIDPLLSWSRYLHQLQPWFDQHREAGWVERVKAMLSLLAEGEDIERMMTVTGEEGVSSTPMPRQQALLGLLETVLAQQPTGLDKAQLRDDFTQLVAWFKNLNYSSWPGPEYDQFENKILSWISKA